MRTALKRFMWHHLGEIPKRARIYLEVSQLPNALLLYGIDSEPGALR
jgi:hypothetical protein